MDKTKERVVTYEDWYLANLQTVSQLKEFHKEVKAIKDNQPHIIKDVIGETVNGKIDRLAKALEAHVRNFDQYVKEDMAWKKDYNPYIKGLANATGGAKIAVWLIASLGTLFGLLLAIKAFFK